jgi:riboflavin kinase/FMN adenylyltransferase
VPASAVAIGNFDGLHKGHIKIINILKKAANRHGYISNVVTFIPNSKIYFKKESKLIFTDQQKKEALEEMAVDKISLIDFKEIVSLSAVDFIKNFLVRKFNLKYLIVGENFRYGKNREGDVNSLKRIASEMKFKIDIVKAVILKKERISSTLIRQKLSMGEIAAANSMLGKDYFIDGKVIKGNQIGRKLGFPTVNIITQNSILPEGVFETKIKIGQDAFGSITNIGYSPTFSKKVKRVETHIVDFKNMIYGQKIRLFFKKKLRDEQKFNSRNELKKQIEKDIESMKVDKIYFF